MFSHDCLRQCDDLAGMCESFLREFFNQLCVMMIPEGNLIMKEGELADKLYILSTGTVEIVAGPKEVQVGVVTGPTLLGPMGLFLAGGRRKATVKARTFCDCRVVDVKALKEILVRYPEEKSKFESLATARMAKVQKVMENYWKETGTQPPKSKSRLMLLSSRSRTRSFHQDHHDEDQDSDAAEEAPMSPRFTINVVTCEAAQSAAPEPQKERRSNSRSPSPAPSPSAQPPKKSKSRLPPLVKKEKTEKLLSSLLLPDRGNEDASRDDTVGDLMMPMRTMPALGARSPMASPRNRLSDRVGLLKDAASRLRPSLPPAVARLL